MIYFDFSEFDSPDRPGSGRTMNVEFLQMIDAARHIADVPFVITSGVRTLKWNAKVGGVKGSSHIKGRAADIACSSSAQRLIIVSALLDVGFRRIGIAKTFIHVDNDPDKLDAIWLY